MINYLIIAAGGALGAISRYAIVMAVQTWAGIRFPIGTLFVNASGSFLMGLFMSLFLGRMVVGTEILRLMFVVGFLGSYTTFSSYAWEILALLQEGQWVMALLNILLNNGLTLIMVTLGFVLGR